MRRLMMFLAVGTVLTACRAKTQPVPPRQGPPTFDDEANTRPDAPPPAESQTPPPAEAEAPGGCRASGSPWDGKLQGCLYEVSGCCYPDDASACAAAGCEGDTCQVLESAPAQVRCTVPAVAG